MTSSRGVDAPGRSAVVLVIDTSTRTSIVAVGDRRGVIARSEQHAGHRHGSHVLQQVEEVLSGAGRGIADVSAIGAGTGPGSFTGLRVGLATAKTLAYARSLPIVGFSSTEALARAADVARAAGVARAPGVARGASGRREVTIVLPAGAHDHYVAPGGRDPRLVAPGADPGLPDGGPPVVAVDLGADAWGEAATRLGRDAVDGLADAALAMVSERLEAGDLDDASTLVPAYVALPRGIAGERTAGWSPDLR